MKKLAYMFAAVVVLAACSVKEEEDGNLNRETTKKIMAQETVGKNLNSNLEVSEDIAIASVFDNGSYRDTEILHRSITTNDLGSRETSEVGEWTVISMTVSEPVRVGVRNGENPLFTITKYSISVRSTITNGEVVMNPEYILNYEDCSWSNGDTTVVFDIHWDILGELVKVNGKVVTDELSTSFCEYRQTANEIGTLTTPTTPAATATVPFTVTTDPHNTNAWLVGCSVPVNGGTMVVVLTPEGNPITSKFWEGDVNTAYNGAYYIPRSKSWYPAIAYDRADCMEWVVNGQSINVLSYTTADDYPNWGNGNRCEYGGHSVHLTGYDVKIESHKLVFSFNGSETGSVNY
jgi:hypothetical protein